MRPNRIFLMTLAVVAASVGGAPARGQAGTDAGERRYALLVGVQQYDKDELRDLKYAEADVTELAGVLRSRGYDVVLMTRATTRDDAGLFPNVANVRKELRSMVAGRGPADRVVVAFAGHGVQFKDSDESYFCPAQAALADRGTLLPLSEVYRELKECRAGLRLLLVDACRNDPLSDVARAGTGFKIHSVSRPQGVVPPGGVAALYSCSEGGKSYEHEKIGHGVFFHFVIEALRGAGFRPGAADLTVSDLKGFVTDHVMDFVRAELRPYVQVPQWVGEERGALPLIHLESRVWINRGLDALWRKDYEQAVFEFSEAARFDRNDPRPLACRGDAYRKLNQPDLALADYSQAVRLNDRYAYAYVKRAEVYNERGEFDKAFSDSDRAVRLAPDAPAYNARGDAHFGRRDFDRAFDDFTAALRCDERFATAYANRGAVFSAKGKNNEAVEECNRALAIDATLALAYANRGAAWIPFGKLDRALADLNKAIELEPRNAVAYTNLGLVYDLKADLDRAIAAYEKAVVLDPSGAPALASLGAVRLKKGSSGPVVPS
jgi:tetratricopeptide (TPR) repeat protein